MTDDARATAVVAHLRPSLVANAVLTIALAAFANESPLIASGAVLCLATTVVQAGVWWNGTRRAGTGLLWLFAAPVPVYALAAGAVIALSAMWEPARSSEEFYPADVKVMAAAFLMLVLWVGHVWRRAANGLRLSDLAKPVVWWQRPEHRALVVQEMALALALLIIVTALVASHKWGMIDAEAYGALLIGLLMAVLALVFGLAARRLSAGAPVSPSMLRSLIAAVDRATLPIGAVRHVHAIDALHTEAGKILVMLQLEFKDGVSAQHITPVLDKLRAALQSELPLVADVLLIPPPAPGL